MLQSSKLTVPTMFTIFALFRITKRALLLLIDFFILLFFWISCLYTIFICTFSNERFAGPSAFSS